MTVICERCKQRVPKVESRLMEYLRIVRELNISVLEIEATNPMLYECPKELTKKVCEVCLATE